MLSVLDRHLHAWHFWLANAAAMAWFAGMSIATQNALPGVKLFRCPIGLCLGYYSPVELQTTLTKIGRNGREFFTETLLPLDMVLPALLLMALTITYLWFSRPDAAFAVPLSPGARYAFLCVPLSYCLADYAENWALGDALQAYPNIPYRLARRASFLTAAKSQLIVASLGIAVALAIAAWGLTRRSASDRN
jgi:ACR3 family arsenite efflux pump ArsB